MANSRRILQEALEKRAKKSKAGGEIPQQVDAFQAAGQPPAGHQDNGRIITVTEDELFALELP